MKKMIAMKVIGIISTAISLDLDQQAAIVVSVISVILLIDISVILSNLIDWR